MSLDFFRDEGENPVSFFVLHKLGLWRIICAPIGDKLNSKGGMNHIALPPYDNEDIIYYLEGMNIHVRFFDHAVILPQNSNTLKILPLPRGEESNKVINEIFITDDEPQLFWSITGKGYEGNAGYAFNHDKEIRKFHHSDPFELNDEQKKAIETPPSAKEWERLIQLGMSVKTYQKFISHRLWKCLELMDD